MKEIKGVMIVSPEVYPKIKIGGLGKMVAGCKRGLEEVKIEVKVVAPEEPIYYPLGQKRTKIIYENLGLKAAEEWQGEEWVWFHDWGGVWSMQKFLEKVKTKTIWTVHSPTGDNYGYEYGYGYESGGEEKIDWGDSFFEFGNLIRQGVKTANLLTTVSTTYAKKLARMELFEGAGEIFGIENGIDDEEWNKERDGLIGSQFRGNWSEFKSQNKKILQRKMGLPVGEVPIFCFVSRLVKQKGVELMLQVLPKFLANHDCQVVIVGSGDKSLEKKVKELKSKHPEKLVIRLEADFELPHQVFAGADYLVLPSVSEPYGIVVAEAKKYGVVPIVHLVDGLKDQVKDKSNGLGFESYQKTGLEQKMEEAIKAWGSEWQKRLWLGGRGVDDWNKVVKRWLTLLNER